MTVVVDDRSDTRHVGVLEDLATLRALGIYNHPGKLGDGVHLIPNLEGNDLVVEISFLVVGSVGSAEILRLVLGWLLD